MLAPGGADHSQVFPHKVPTSRAWELRWRGNCPAGAVLATVPIPRVRGATEARDAKTGPGSDQACEEAGRGST
jgi:hypothetical protein